MNIFQDTELLKILLADRTTGKNIKWATKLSFRLGDDCYSSDSSIEIEQITGKDSVPIVPRTEKNKLSQQDRTKSHAEVFTPSWICNKQNNLIDNEWFGREGVFNTETDKSWIATTGKIEFPDGKTWKDYVTSTRLEITCGEAPYLVSRYDTTTGDTIPLNARMGLLDRKLRVIGENTSHEEEWLIWAYKAFKSIYGYEYQGDNLLLARQNLLLTFVEYYQDKFGKEPPREYIEDIAYIISWNIWQMDGLKCTVPMTCDNAKEYVDVFGKGHYVLENCKGCKEDDIFNHNGILATIKDWNTGEVFPFLTMLMHE